MSEPNVVYFAHGKDSGPWGSKIQLLAKLAEAQGLAVESPDYQDLETGQDRLEKLNHLLAQDSRSPILVGSSMGGWVSAQMAASQPCDGLFLMAPAFEMPDHESALCPMNKGLGSSMAVRMMWCPSSRVSSAYAGGRIPCLMFPMDIGWRGLISF